MIHHIDCLEFMRGMVERGDRVNAIITDPPYLYLNHKLDRKFNEREFFELASNLTDKIVFFGRGDSFYKWNLLCAEFGFEFKEEIVWEKQNISSPTLPIGRLHELVAIRIKKNAGGVKVVKIPYITHIVKNRDFKRIENDVRTISTALKDSRFMKFVEKGEKFFCKKSAKHSLTTNRGAVFLLRLTNQLEH